jgi:membrane associated rhomboid family serine protease
MILPFRSKNPPESLPLATVLLIVANVTVFFLTSDGLAIREEVLGAWGLSAANFGPLHMLTSMFLHGDLFHLAGNMWFLYLFGFAVEGRLRTFKFLVLYLAAGAAGDLLHHLAFGAAQPDLPSIGASGAIMGVMGAALYMFPFGRVSVLYFFGIWWYGQWQVPMWGIALWYLGVDIVMAVVVGALSGVAHLAHLGGAVGGVLVCLLLRPRRDSMTASDAKATFDDTRDLSLLSQSELAEMHRSNPDDTTIVLNWMHRSLRDTHGVGPDCLHAFKRLLPKMLQEHDPGPIGFCVASLAYAPGALSPRILVDMAGRLERAGDPSLALKLYEGVLRDPASSASDQETATYRIGLICESSLGNFPRAAESYRRILREWPMGPFGDQAKSRLQAVEARLARP